MLGEVSRYMFTGFSPKFYWKLRNYMIKHSKYNIFAQISRFLVRRMEYRNGSSIGGTFGSGATFQTIPKLPHGLVGIFIHPSAKIGKNVTIYQQVTIGENGFGSKAAVIGDNVVIGSGAKIIGPVNIGDNVIVGANAVVTKDISKNQVVGGIPAKILYSK